MIKSGATLDIRFSKIYSNLPVAIVVASGGIDNSRSVERDVLAVDKRGLRCQAHEKQGIDHA